MQKDTLHKILSLTALLPSVFLASTARAETFAPPSSEKPEAVLEILIEAIERLPAGHLSSGELSPLPEGTAPEASVSSQHWAYSPPSRPELPEVGEEEWCSNAIDRFILAKMEEQRLSPSPPESKPRWLRRVHFDLIGLPPTPEEVEAFIEDDEPGAEERVIEALLQSPHYGERQARYWLDLARYADSGGYHVDPFRPIWAYRDWVIEAFNRDLPFDRFTIEQLAGDLLPNPSRDQLIATGFHRNTMFNEEGGIDPEEFRVKAVIDRVDTTATVWLGTTLACAQCHDHKFDPFTQEEYFQFYSIFNNTSELGGGTYASKEPLVHLLSPDQEKERQDLEGQIAAWERTLQTPTADLAKEQSDWEEVYRSDFGWTPLKPVWYVGERGTHFVYRQDGSLSADGPQPSTETVSFVGKIQSERLVGVRLEILPATPGQSLGRFPEGTPGLNEVEIYVGDSASLDPTDRLDFAAVTLSHHPDSPEKIHDGKGHTGWILDTTEENGAFAYLALAMPIENASGMRLKTVLKQTYGLKSTLHRFRVSTSSSEGPIRVPEPTLRAILAKSPESRTEMEKESLARYFRTIAKSLDDPRSRLAKLQKTHTDLLSSVSTTLVMKEREIPRETRIQLRGDFQRTGEKVSPAIPALFRPEGERGPANRLELAEWLVDPSNPLTARVAMNRLWEQIFGRGLVETGEDFGTQGALPTHPELLDWLATEFVRSGWSMKAMRQLILSSATYRQSSKVSKELLEQDPYNTWLARGPRFRLDAEAIRDNALSVSGLLNPSMGGPSVFPYQPPGLWSINSPGYGLDDWKMSKLEDRYRRGLYTFWRKSNPYPAFVVFDAPQREYCTVKRARTNTPLQALNVLNDPVYEEASVALAARLLSASHAEGVEEKIAFAIRLCLAREATEFEIARLADLFQDSLKKYVEAPDLCAKVPRPERVSFQESWKPEEIAAWSVVANALLNLDEMLTKG
jgi:hypothetical protein